MTIDLARQYVEMFPGRFYEKQEIVNGKVANIFNYHIAPTPKEVLENPGLSELRGLTFIDGMPFFSMKKFFNVNEGQGWMESDLKEMGIKNVYSKMDGSMIHCVSIEGKIYAKTKGTFNSPQAIMAQEIINRQREIRCSIAFMFSIGLYPIFELIGPDNRHVLNYSRNELILLDIRQYKNSIKETVSRLDDWISHANVPCNFAPIECEMSLDDLLELQESETDCEGWVVHFNNGQMAKFKTKWYFENHRLILGDDMNRIDGIVSRIMNETIDDSISALEAMGHHERISSIKDKIDNFNKWYSNVSLFLDSVFKEISPENAKEIALRWRDHKWFSIIMKARKSILNNPDEAKHGAITEYVERNIRTMSIADSWWQNDVLSLY